MTIYNIQLCSLHVRYIEKGFNIYYFMKLGRFYYFEYIYNLLQDEKKKEYI